MSYGTVRLERCTDKRHPLRTTKFTDGSRPFFQVENNGLRLCAPADLATNGQYASLTITDSSFEFEPEMMPWSQAIFGYGFSPMDLLSVGTQIPEFSDPVTRSLWQMERTSPDPDTWRPVEIDGQRWMRSDKQGGHAFYFDSEVNTPNNTYQLTCSLVRADYEADPEVPDVNRQWKSIRWQSDANVDSDGFNLYAKTFDQDFSLSQRSITVRYWDEDDSVWRNGNCYSMQHPVHDNNITQQILMGFSGVRDTFTGFLKTAESKAGVPYSERSGSDQPLGEAGALRLMSVVGNQGHWKTTFFQDYYDNMNGSRSTWRRDTFTQYGSLARIQIGDASTPATSSFNYVAPIVGRVDANTIQILFWKSLFADWDGLWLHYFNQAGVYVKSMQVNE